MDSFYVYLTIWYLIGAISFIAWVKHVNGFLSYRDIAMGLTLCGVAGLATPLIICGVAIDNPKFKEWWIKKRF